MFGLMSEAHRTAIDRNVSLLYYKDWFTGMIDEVKLYNRGLTEAEVLESMQGPSSVKPDGKLAVKWGEIKSNN